MALTGSELSYTGSSLVRPNPQKGTLSMTMIIALPRSLEDLRNHRYETAEEFTRFLGISEQTYRRLLRRDPTVQNPTKRQIAERLGTPPHLITELIPPPSDAYIATLTTAIREANQHG
jgi:transcriptional regulator with XRE-family HTH domain